MVPFTQWIIINFYFGQEVINTVMHFTSLHIDENNLVSAAHYHVVNIEHCAHISITMHPAQKGINLPLVSLSNVAAPRTQVTGRQQPKSQPRVCRVRTIPSDRCTRYRYGSVVLLSPWKSMHIDTRSVAASTIIRGTVDAFVPGTLRF